MTTPRDVQAIVADNGGAIAGKTRLQKSAYFLEVCGVGSGYDFSYHYYGPYSEELALDATDAQALRLIQRDWEHSASGFPYAMYRTHAQADDGAAAARRREVLGTLNGHDAIVLELAATAHFLSVNGFAHDPWTETRRRKAGKATDDRIAAAKELLRELGFLALAE